MISPYLFVWQSSKEAEEQRIDPDKRPLKREPHKEAEETKRIRIDTLVGMAVSNGIALAIIITTAERAASLAQLWGRTTGRDLFPEMLGGGRSEAAIRSRMCCSQVRPHRNRPH